MMRSTLILMTIGIGLLYGAMCTPLVRAATNARVAAAERAASER